jgi:hypothetical protein
MSNEAWSKQLQLMPNDEYLTTRMSRPCSSCWMLDLLANCLARFVKIQSGRRLSAQTNVMVASSCLVGHAIPLWHLDAD